MEVVSPMVSSPQLGIDFESPTGSPYATAPSSPQRRIFFSNFSAPSSPSRTAKFYDDFHGTDPSVTSPFLSGIPFKWEEKPGTPKARDANKEDEDYGEEFEFNLGGDLNRTSLSAEELFDKGKIRPLKPPPGYDYSSQNSSPRSPTPLINKKDFDPFQAALDQTRKSEANLLGGRRDRGRVRTGSNRVKGGSRSLSPLRVSDTMFYPEESFHGSTLPRDRRSATSSQSKQSIAASIFSAFSFSPKGNRKWKLRDLLLFRSASEGRARESRRIFNGDSSMRNFSVISKQDIMDDVKNSSIRSSGSSVTGSFRKPVSSAEFHYAMNRAMSEEVRKKTPLPYKQGLGCLGFIYPHHPTMHDVSRGIGSLSRGR